MGTARAAVALLLAALVVFALIQWLAPSQPAPTAQAQEPESTPQAQPDAANPPAAAAPEAAAAPVTEPPASAPDVVVLGGIEEVEQWLQGENWWGENARGQQLEVPNTIITGINARWRETAQTLPVPVKKEVFYRLMLPLIVHANDMVRERRAALERSRDRMQQGLGLDDADLESLREGLVLLRVADTETAAAIELDDPDMPALIDEMLYKLDIVPAGLALGQAAYESGYGTSRFAVEGNALFGQWTYGGEGLVPEQQRRNLGDHRIAAYDWPFDSVRGYFLNLMSHPAYEPFRKLRAELRASGARLDSLTLADGLISYSERGQEYVDTLKGMIRVNNLDVADGARFRDEPMRLLIAAGDPETADALREQMAEMRSSGELATIVERMRL